MCNPITTARPDALLDKGMWLGYEYEVTSNGRGYRCGYVRIPPGHPWHGKGYDDIEPYPEVHGGLTFARPDVDCGKGGDDNDWWLGFDCAHYMDAPDPSLPGYRPDMPAYGSIKTTSYVAGQCRSLAKQAAAVVQ